MLMTKTRKAKATEEGDGWVSRTFRLPKELNDWLNEMAEEARRSANHQLVWILERARASKLCE